MPALDREFRKNILDARQTVQQAYDMDCNEAETRRRIERMFETLMGYDAFRNLSRERAVRGAGETEHVDYAIQFAQGEKAKPEIMVEIKRVCADLETKHLKQVSSYAINAGCEWLILTNSREWRLYHVSFGQPPITKMIYSWNLLTDDLSILAERFDLLSLRSLKRGVLESVWQKTNVLDPKNLLQTILGQTSLAILRRELRRDFGVSLTPEEIVTGIRRLLNENALNELEGIRIYLGEKKIKRRRPKEPGGEEEQETSSSQEYKEGSSSDN